MLKKLLFGLLILSFGFSLIAFAKVPKDFRFEYENRAGQLEMGTVEKIVVTPGLIIVTRSAKHIGEGSDKKQTSKTYHPNDEQMDGLIKIVESSGFMSWPASAEIPHQSRADEYFQITLNGKTVRHTKWEQANQEAFRILWTHFNDWFRDIRAVRF